MNMKSAPCVVHINTTSMLINLKSDPNNFLEKKIIKIKIKRDLIAQNRERERERGERKSIKYVVIISDPSLSAVDSPTPNPWPLHKYPTFIPLSIRLTLRQPQPTPLSLCFPHTNTQWLQ
jgi:hypothetical protein